MRNLTKFISCVLLFGIIGNINAQISTTYALIERVTPGFSNQFKLELIEQDNNQDVYEITSGKGKVVLRGNNAIALATAYNQYLKYTCKCHVSWLGDQLNLPKRLPMPKSTIRNIINGKYRIYMNYCTLSYSAVWWDWKRWERELDFMAMNSINMPLSVVGLEAVWYNTLLKYGFTDIEARSFLAGPGHLAWQWMQNIQSYGGPLPKSWIDKHVILGKQIMKRQLELGMKPIQQGFSGYVPREFIEKFPHAKILLQPSWCGFKGVAQLDPTDSLFNAFGRDFLYEEKKLFGAHGVYAADPFHESKPPIDKPEYLEQVGQSIYKLLTRFDKNAIWAMQAWSLRESIVKAVPKEHLLILDLNGEKSKTNNTFWGYPTVSGNLHNFGGRINLHGDLPLLASNQYLLARKRSSNICGNGLFMEGIEQNPVYYDLAFEMPLHSDTVNLNVWLKEYTHRRYGNVSESAFIAWKYLLEGPYRKGTNGTERSSIIAARPALNVKKSGPNVGLGIPYPPHLLIKAESLLIQDANKLKSSEAYRFDLIDVQRQLMSNLGQEIHKKAADAFRANNKKDFELHSSRFLQLLLDTDSLLRTRPEPNMYRWLSEARRWGNTTEEKNMLEKDATSLITIWGGDGDPLIFDYSWREWAGLIETYYLPRWKQFYDMLSDCLNKNKTYIEEKLRLTHGRESFRANEFYENLANWELKYVSKTGKLDSPITVGDEIEIAKNMFNKYSVMANEYYDNDTRNMHIDLKSGKSYENLGDSK